MIYKKLKVNKSIAFESLLTMLIFILSFLVFGYVFKGTDGYGYHQEIIAALIGTLLTVVITSLILKKQARSEEQKETNIGVFQKKVDRFEKITNLLAVATEDDKISEDEAKAIRLAIYDLALFSSVKSLSILERFLRSKMIGDTHVKVSFFDVISEFRNDLQIEDSEEINKNQFQIIDLIINSTPEQLNDYQKAVGVMKDLRKKLLTRLNKPDKIKLHPLQPEVDIEVSEIDYSSVGCQFMIILKDKIFNVRNIIDIDYYPISRREPIKITHTIVSSDNYYKEFEYKMRIRKNIEKTITTNAGKKKNVFLYDYMVESHYEKNGLVITQDIKSIVKDIFSDIRVIRKDFFSMDYFNNIKPLSKKLLAERKNEHYKKQIYDIFEKIYENLQNEIASSNYTKFKCFRKFEISPIVLMKKSVAGSISIKMDEDYTKKQKVKRFQFNLYYPASESFDSLIFRIRCHIRPENITNIKIFDKLKREGFDFIDKNHEKFDSSECLESEIMKACEIDNINLIKIDIKELQIQIIEKLNVLLKSLKW